jgi:hypothetical protein
MALDIYFGTFVLPFPEGEKGEFLCHYAYKSPYLL